MSFDVLITVGVSTIPIPAFLAALSMSGISQWFFGFALLLTPSKLMYSVLTPSCLSRTMRSGSKPSRIAVVFSCIWSKPASFAFLTISGRSALMVGSPPVSCIALEATGFCALSFLNMRSSSSSVGSYIGSLR